MINIENEIFTGLRTALISAHAGIFVTGEYTPTPTQFPCAFIEESDNFVAQMDGSNGSALESIMYEVNVFSNKATGRKSEAKAIIQTINSYMQAKGFRRQMCNPIPNEDTTIYRITARYVANVLNDTIYRR